MASSFAYRGPDDEGFFLRNAAAQDDVSIGLGHRRLSIIDLSEAGRQPISNEDGTVWIVFNGEIYNFPSLRKELEGKGHRFRSQTDSEIIVHLYEEEGVDGFRSLDGMFAFALWDARSQSLILCRDRIGIKPLVYGRFGGSFLFASEIKSILQDAEIPREIDWNSLELYLTFNYIPAPYTIFKGINKLKPGHFLVFRNGGVTEKPYWNLIKGGSDDFGGDFEAAKRALLHTLEGAIVSHMISDVPLGAFLSGGIDSSIVAALMARNSSFPVKTFTIGFADMPLFDETAYARDVAMMYGTDHREFKLESRDILDAVPRVIGSLDEPFADSSAVPTYIVSRETAREVKVVLSGDGGDELFAGYRMYAGEHWYRRYRLIPYPLRRFLIEPAVSLLPESRDSRLLEYSRRAKKFLRGAKGSFEERFFAWNEIFPRELREDLFQPPEIVNRDLGKEILAGRLAEFRDGAVNRMLYADLKESLPGDMLHKVDAMSMLNSLEVRVPILDHRFCELAFSLDDNWKIRNGRGKHIFIEAFKDLLPPSLHNRPKWGFEIPVGKWLKKELRFLTEDYLSSSRIRRGGVLNPDAVQRLTDRFFAGRDESSWQIWNLIVFQSWHARYFGNGG
jgi:asparagine synthase (glutamine-hydrolysing)